MSHLLRCTFSFIKRLCSPLIPSRSNSLQQCYLQQKKENLSLAYASYESTESYSALKPEPIPLVLLHGLLGSKNNWNSFCKRYQQERKCKVYAVDTRNHGDSPHSREHSYDDIVVDLKLFLNKMELKKVHLLGHSMGGKALMMFALKYPEQVDKLIVADISPITTSTSFKKMPQLLQALNRVEMPEKVSLSVARKLTGDNLARFVKSKGVMNFLLANLVQKSDGRYGWRFNIKALMDNFDEISSFPEMHNITFDGPVLFIGGGKSDYIQRSDFPKIQKLFPNAELKYIDGAGHWLHSEKPAEFLQVTLDFLNKKTPVNA